MSPISQLLASTALVALTALLHLAGLAALIAIVRRLAELERPGAALTTA